MKLDQQAQAVKGTLDKIPYFQINDTLNECKRLSQPELISELKSKGTYNPDLMAWDALGVIRFLDRTIQDQYQVSYSSSSGNALVLLPSGTLHPLFHSSVVFN